MNKWSRRSAKNLATCHEDLQDLFNEVLIARDCSVIWGHRGEEDQNKAFKSGASKAKWGQSPHNFDVSMAADVIPYPINSDWDKDIEKMKAFGNFVKGVAHGLGIDIEWGGDWKYLKDYAHFEIVGWKSLKPS